MNWSIREAVSTDAPGIVRTIKAVYDEYGFTWDESDYHADLYDIEHHYLSRGHEFLVAELEGQVVGTAALMFFPIILGESDTCVIKDDKVRIAGCDCALERLYVDPAARRLGIGAGLMQALIELGRARGAASMEIWSDKRFVEAHRLYERFGAMMIGERICHDPDQSPEWGLALHLK